MKDGPVQQEQRGPQSRAFKATIVFTHQGGHEPTLKDVETAIRRAGFTAFAMPAQTDGPIVLSFSEE